MEEAGGACWLGKRRRELVLRASRLIHVRLVWVSAVLDPSRTSTTMLWSPSPLRSPSYVFPTGQVAASPLTWPHIQPQRCLSTCGLGGVTCSWCKKGPAAQTLQRQNKAKTNAPPRTTSHHPETRPSAIVTGMLCWLGESGCADQARNSRHEAISGRNRVPLQTHLLPRASPSVARRSDAGFGAPHDDGHRLMARDYGARLKLRSRCREVFDGNCQS